MSFQCLTHAELEFEDCVDVGHASFGGIGRFDGDDDDDDDTRLGFDYCLVGN